jgi:thiol-disulfide isomerase/thioredoxin
VKDVNVRAYWAAGFATTLLLWTLLTPRAGQSGVLVAAVGKPAPAFMLEDLNGFPLSSKSFRGKPLYINVFATWCPPCRIELPEIVRSYERYKAAVAYLGVDEQEPAGTIEPFRRTMGILAQYPTPVAGDIVQYELGFGAAFGKQIGFGNETDGDERLSFVETQVGNGDHACNPNTLKKVYLRRNTFADVFTPYPARTYVTRSGNMLTRWGDGVGPSASDLLLLDTKTLYDPRRATIVHVAPAGVTVDGRTIPTTHVRAHYRSAVGQQLRSVDQWLSAAVPLGLVKMTATAPDVDPFHLSVYKFARHFKTELAMSSRRSAR